MYQRFFSAKDEREARRSVVGWVIGVILIGIALQSLAVVGSGMFPGLDENQAGRIILLVAHDGLPVVVGCILMASIVAIIVSTANSFLLVPATNIMRDIVQRFIKPDITDKGIVFWSRFVVVILGLCAYSLLSFFPRVLSAAYAAYTVYGAGITPALLATFFWKRATPNAHGRHRGMGDCAQGHGRIPARHAGNLSGVDLLDGMSGRRVLSGGTTG
jgi:Na+/proline symporter